MSVEENIDPEEASARTAAMSPDGAEGAPGGETGSQSRDEMPPVPDDIRKAARLAPDQWLGMVDPLWTGEGSPPAWAVVGHWRSGPTGEIEAWRANVGYRPSPTAYGWPEPVDDVDAAMQLAATGYGPVDDVPRALAVARVAVLTGVGGRPLAATTRDGDPVILVFTTDDYLDSVGQLGAEVMPVSDLVDELPDGHRLYVNPTGPVSMVVETEMLAKAIAAANAQSAPETSDTSDDDSPTAEHSETAR
jgi:hypothetical protein